ncbi:hypothetical protein Ddc_20780 [Ditylenchus destructor]|nr:hypothetical protein Ddc_20780 [Ditylenchus destructor]
MKPSLRQRPSSSIWRACGTPMGSNSDQRVAPASRCTTSNVSCTGWPGRDCATCNWRGRSNGASRAGTGGAPAHPASSASASRAEAPRRAARASVAEGKKDGVMGRSGGRGLGAGCAAKFAQHAQTALRTGHERVGRIPGVAGQDGADHAADLGLGAFIEDHILEFAAVPALDVGAEGLDTHHQRVGEVGLPVDRFAAQLAVQGVGGQLGRAQGDGDAGREHRVQEFGGVAQQGKARAVQPRDAGRIAADGVGGRVPHRIAQHPLQIGSGLGHGAQRGHQVFVGAAEQVLSAHHAERAAAVRERNQPVPDAVLFGVHADQYLFAVKAGVVDAVFEVGEDGFARRHRRWPLQVEQARQHAAVAAGVQHEPAAHLVLAAVGAAHVQQRTIAREIGGGHFLQIAHFHALARGVVGQHLVELGPLHLEGGAGARSELVAEIEVGILLAAGKGGAVLDLEAGGLHGRHHAGFLDKFQAVGQQAFTDGKARELLAFEHQDVMPLALEQRGGHCPGGACPDDNHFPMFHAGCFL